MTQQKLPPQSLAAEQAILGAVLLENSTLNKIMEIISPEDFYRASHRQIYSAMLELWEKNEPIDIITVSERLRSKNQLEEVGGVAHLAELNDCVPTAAGAVSYAKIVQDKAKLRNLIRASTEILDDAYEEREEIDVLVDDAERKIFDISQRKVRPSLYPMRELTKESFKTIEQLYAREKQVSGVPTSFKDLDDRTSGLQPSDLIVVASRPGMGKTSLCLNLAQHAAIEHNVPVVIFSMEMSKEQVALRMLCSKAKVDVQKARSGYLSKADWGPLVTAAGALADAPIYVDDTATMNVLELRAKARRWKSQYNLGLIIIDYLQLMRGRGQAERRDLEISEISRSLKALAKELSLPIVVLSQLSRAVEQREDKRPQLAHLRESGAIEQDADLVLLLFRKAFYDPNYAEDADEAELIIAKQRNGPTGTIRLTFLRKCARFESYEAPRPF